MTAVAVPLPRNRRRLPEATLVRLLQVAGLIAFLAVWQAAGAVRPQFYSSPTRMLAELWRLIAHQNLLALTLNSLVGLAIGLAISFVIGVTIGVLIGRYRIWRVALEPYMAALYSVPRVAFVPVMVIWFGIGRTFIISTVIVAAAVQIAFATAGGVRVATREYAEIAEALRLGPRESWLKVLIPGSLPFIATGLRLGVKRGLTAVIVGEFLIGVPGVGYALRTARVTMATDQLFAVATFLMVLGVTVITVIERAEHRFASWRPQAF